jgi:lauroyl/myristoyl acyltransferase
MSLKDHLQTREILEAVARQSWKHGRTTVLEQGMAYYDGHAEDVAQVRSNIGAMGLDDSDAAVSRALAGIVAHYFEKFFVMTKNFEAHWMVENRIDAGNALEPLHQARAEGKGVFIGQSHFGGTYLLVPTLITHGFDMSFVGLFPGPVFHMLEANVNSYTERWKTGRATIVNVADEGALVPEIMMGSLSTGELVMNVFDENNAFSREVDLLGTRIWGGSGMDRILSRMDPDKVVAATPFAIRTGDESYRIEIDMHDLRSVDIIQDMFDSLGRRVSANPDQWYFLQELQHSLHRVK